MRKVTFTVYMGLERLDRLDSLSKRTGISRSALVDHAVKELLDKPPRSLATQAINGSPPSRRRAVG